MFQISYMLKTKNLSYHYPQSKGITFPNICVDATLLIQGASGCGKTTLLHLLAGLINPSQGEISIYDNTLTDFDSGQKDQFRGKHIGIIYQQSFFIESLSIMDNLLLSPFALSKTKASEISKRLNIDMLLSRKPHQLSIGEQQRVNICRAMMNEPKLILADEPTSALDDKNCEEVLDLLKQEAKMNHAALVIATHDNRLKDAVSNYIELEAR